MLMQPDRIGKTTDPQKAYIANIFLSWSFPQRRPMSRSNFYLIFIIFVAAGLRLWGLENSSLWTDELSSWRHSHQPSLIDVINSVKPDAHPPAYFALLHYVIKYFGDSEFWLRLPSALAGIVTVYLTFLLGRQLYSSREGYIAAAIMALSWAPIYYSQEARAYSLLLLVSIALFHYWQKIMWAFNENTEIPKSTYLAYLVTATMMNYLHYFGLQLVVLQLLGFCALFVFRPHILLKIAVLYSLVFLAYLPWVPVMMGQMSAHSSHWIAESTFLDSAASLVVFSYKIDTTALVLLIAPAYFYALFTGLRNIGHTQTLSSCRAAVFSSGGLLVLWVTIPFLAAFAQSIVIRPILIDRYLIFILPAVYILLARGIALAPLTLGRIWVVLICIVLFVTLVFDEHYYSQPQKDQYREAVEYASLSERNHEDFPFIAFTWRKEFFDYYLDRFGSQERVSLNAGMQEDIPKLEEYLEKGQPDGFWYLVGQRKPQKEFLQQLSKNYVLVDEVLLKDASASLYLKLDRVELPQ